MNIKFLDDLNFQLQDFEFQREWIRQTILEYAQDGDFVEFFRALEQVIKARTTVSEFAKNVGMNRVQLVDILHGRTKVPSIVTFLSVILSSSKKLWFRMNLNKMIDYRFEISPYFTLTRHRKANGGSSAC